MFCLLKTSGLITLFLGISLTAAYPQSGTWTSTSSGSWGTSSKWTNNIIANGATNMADFTTVDLPYDLTVTLDQNRTLGIIQLRDTGGSSRWTLEGDATLTLDNGVNVPKVRALSQVSLINVRLAGTNGVVSPDQRGTIVLQGSNTYTGDTYIFRGTLQIGNANALPSGARNGNVVMINGGSSGFPQLDLDTFDITINGLSSVITNLAAPLPKITSSNSIPGTTTLTVGDNNANGSYNGQIEDGPVRKIALKKIGTGNLTMGGTYTYTGGTTVTGGTLLLSGSLLGTGTAQAHSGGTISGTGRIGSPVMIATGGTISPGSGLGTMTLSNGLSFNGGAYLWELGANSTEAPGTNFDQILLGGGNLGIGPSRVVIRYTGTAAAPHPAEPFWQSPHTWNIIQVSGGMNAGMTTFQLVDNGITPAGWFWTSANAQGGIDLHFTPGTMPSASVDLLAASERPFPQGTRGQCPYRTASDPAYRAMFQMSRGSLMRGIAGGLDADAYDWRVRHSGSKWGTPAGSCLVTTLDFLRSCRDTTSEPLLSANMFAGGYTNEFGTWVCQFDNHTNIYNPGGNGVSAVPGTAVQLAADWVRYCNVLIQTYRQGQEALIGSDPNFSPVENAENLRVYNSLKLGGDWGGKDVLLAAAEAAVPKVVLWEVGNEPEVDLGANSTLVTQHVIADKTVFRDRYRAIAAAMKAVDSSVRTGPCLTGGGNNEWLGRLAEDPNSPLDFVSVHPYLYGLKYSYPNPTNMTPALLDIARTVADSLTSTIVTLSNYGGLTRFGTQPSGWYTNVPLIASEYNPVNWDATSALKASMGSGLATLEQCFRFAHPGTPRMSLPSFYGANYWENPAGYYALSNVFGALRDFGGDFIVENILPGPKPAPDFAPAGLPMRVYITRQTNSANRLHVWALNFSEDQDLPMQFSIANVPFKVGQVTLRTFAKPGGENSLTNRIGLGWTSQDLTPGVAPSNFTVTVPNASFATLTFDELIGTRQPRIESAEASGTNLVLAGSGGIVDRTYRLVSSESLSAPTVQWIPVLTNTFGPAGSFTATLPISPWPGARFFRLETAE